jgi:hypothetical protein
MLLLRLVLGISACGLLAVVAMVLYDIWLAYELDRMNRHASIALSAKRTEVQDVRNRAAGALEARAPRH